MLITAIEPQKRNKQRVSLYLDGCFCCGLSLETAVKCRLKVGLIIEKEELENIVLESEKNCCFNMGLKYVSRKMCTEKEMRVYLGKKEFLPAAVDYAVDKLTEYKYINDGEYAKAYISCGQSKGILKIKFDLKAKGVNESLINQETELIKAKQFDVCRALAEKYVSKKELNLKTKQSLYRYLISKGFESEVVNVTVRKIFGDCGDFNE